MNIEQNPPSISNVPNPFHVSQSFSSSITREFQKETEKEMGSVTAEYTRTDMQYFSYVIVHFCWMDTNG